MREFPRPNKDLIDKAPSTVEFNGRTYYKANSGRYYRPGRSLHRDVWIFYNGPIPKGYHIHHIDRNPSNNHISNLACLSPEEHSEIHKQLLTEEERQWFRENMDKNARPEANKWHGSEEGRAWHSKHNKENWEKGVFTQKLVCAYCGKNYVGVPYKNGTNHFCSNRCKVAYRRHSGVDDVPRVCQWCGKTFMANKRKGTKTCSKECQYKRLSAIKKRKKSDTNSLF